MPTQNTGISLATELADVAKEAMFELDVLTLGAKIVGEAKDLSEDELISLLFKYSGTLVANVSSRITHTLLSETQIKDMVSEIEMFEEIEKDVMGN